VAREFIGSGVPNLPEASVTGTTEGDKVGPSAPEVSPSELGRGEERLRLALEAARMGTWTWDITTGRVDWDEAMEVQFGLPSASFGGTFERYVERVHPDDREAVRTQVALAVESSGDLRIEHRILWPNGEVHWIEGRGRVVRDEDGNVVGMVGIGMNIDQRKAWESVMAESARLRASQERSTIRVLQEALVRPDFPALDGYRLEARSLSAEGDDGIGGDWYDAFALDDRRVMLTIGDVAGHGLGAARTMAKLRHAARAFACEDPSAGSVLGRLDAFLRHLRHDDCIVTAQVAILDTAEHVLEIASAGHPPPILIDRTGHRPLEVRGTALGVRASARHEPERVELEGASLLAFYTDGLIERPGEHLDVGLARIMEALAVQPVVSDLGAICTAAIEAGLGDYELRDDACIMLLARDDR
jgi:phosphoserine phosphatase RsbU/P